MARFQEGAITENSASAPLVTFAILAYNQEMYIRSSIEAAFAQDYSNLEIILSDDESSDSTFAIMQEMADDYDGPHTVRLRRGELNIGTALHLSAVARLARGEILVIAAGDDISLPHRCSSIVSHWLTGQPGVACVHSAALLFDDEDGFECFHPPRSETISSEKERIEFLLKDQLPFLSPTCAYSTAMMAHFGDLVGGTIIEDGQMAMRSLGYGKVVAVDDALVRVRVSLKSSGRGNTIRSPEKWNLYMRSQINCYANKLKDISKLKFDQIFMYKLESLYLSKLKYLPSFIFPVYGRNYWWRMRFIFVNMFLFSTNHAWKVRISRSLTMAGYSDGPVYRSMARFYKRATKRSQ